MMRGQKHLPTCDGKDHLGRACPSHGDSRCPDCRAAVNEMHAPGCTEHAAQMREVDMVNHPPHYRPLYDLDFDCIDVTRAMTFDPGNSTKYVWRFADKNGRQDVEKAEWYLKDAVRHAVSTFAEQDSAATREARKKLHRVADRCPDPKLRRFWLAMRDDSISLALEAVREVLAAY